MLVFNPWVKANNKYYILRSQKSGVITNINLEKLKQFGELLEEEANGNGKAFNRSVEETENINIKANGPPNKKLLEQNGNRYLLKGFRDTVDEAHNELICIDKTLIKDQSTLHKLNNLAKECFTIEEICDPSEAIRKNIEGLKYQFIKAIRNGVELSEFEKMYISLAEAFLETISKLGGYSFKQAHEERRSLFGGFKEIRWLCFDIGDFLQEAAKTKDVRIIDNVFYLPIAIAYRAIDYKDQYIFQEFIEFSDYLYLYASKMPDEDSKKILLDRAWRYLSEMGNFYITSKLMDGSSNEEDLETYKDFAIYLFYPFQKLLKESFDNKDLEGFKQFYNATLNLFATFYLNVSIPENVSKEINAKREQMLFGVASWIFDKFSQNKNDLQLKEFYDTVRGAFGEDIKEFTEVFINCSIDYWGWDSWELEGAKEGQVHFIRFSEKLNKFFAVNALSILSLKTSEEIKEIELPFDRNFAFLVGDKNSDLNKLLSDIKSNPDNWKFVLSDEAISKIDLFTMLLERVKVAQEKKDSEEKRQKRISEKKVEEFKETVVKEFYKQATLRQIFQHYNLYQDKTEEIIGDDKHKFGFFNLLDDKAAFFEEWYVYYLNWGKNYGRSLASSENSFLLDKIMRECTEIEESAFEDKLLGFKNLDNIIIITTDMPQSWQFFENTKNFIPKWYKNSQDYKDLPTIDLASWEGWYKLEEKLIPIFWISHGKANGSILILDKSKLGNLVQFSPLTEKDDQRFLKDIFFMDIRPLSEMGDLIKKLINEQPEWLVKKHKEIEQQKQYLHELVVINIYESFEYCKTEDFRGYVFALK
jgi:hypothetical protein